MANKSFSVEVTGHRPNRLKYSAIPELRRQIQRILRLIKTLEPAGSSKNRISPGAQVKSGLWVLTSLAEGTDRIVAEEGLAIGYFLHCALPFSPLEYEKDFGDDESRRHFRLLLSKAASVQVLTNTFKENQRSKAYAEARWQVLQNSDILIAIWDGKPERGVGGTGQMVR